MKSSTLIATAVSVPAAALTSIASGAALRWPAPMLRSRALRRLATLLPAAALVAACAEKPPAAPDVRPVRVTRAMAADAQGVTTYAGEIKARYETDMSFRVGGKILARLVDAGATVKKGQALARLDAQDANLNAAAARANLAAADSELEFAKAELARYDDLLSKKFVSQGVYDQKLNAHKAAVAKRDSAAAQSSVSGNQAGYSTLTADADGVVTAVTAEPGQVVAAGQAVVRIARLGDKDAVINVAENQLAAVKANPRAGIVLWSNPDKRYAGTVREIAAAADPVTRTYTVKVKIDDADEALRWGMSATVGFVPAAANANAGSAKAAAAASGASASSASPSSAAASSSASSRAIVLPMTALTQTDDKTGAKPAVWVVGADGKVKLVPVTVGTYSEQGVVIQSGLAGGETVVIAGVHKLQAGQQVKPLAPEMPVAQAAMPGAAARAKN